MHQSHAIDIKESNLYIESKCLLKPYFTVCSPAVNYYNIYLYMPVSHQFWLLIMDFQGKPMQGFAAFLFK